MASAKIVNKGHLKLVNTKTPITELSGKSGPRDQAVLLFQNP